MKYAIMEWKRRRYMAVTESYLMSVMHRMNTLEDVFSDFRDGICMIFYQEKRIGCVYDDKFYFLAVPKAKELFPESEQLVPVEGTEMMIEVPESLEGDALAEAVKTIYPECPMGGMLWL